MGNFAASAQVYEYTLGVKKRAFPRYMREGSFFICFF